MAVAHSIASFGIPRCKGDRFTRISLAAVHHAAQLGGKWPNLEEPSTLDCCGSAFASGYEFTSSQFGQRVELTALHECILRYPEGATSSNSIWSLGYAVPECNHSSMLGLSVFPPGGAGFWVGIDFEH